MLMNFSEPIQNSSFISVSFLKLKNQWRKRSTVDVKIVISSRLITRTTTQVCYLIQMMKVLLQILQPKMNFSNMKQSLNLCVKKRRNRRRKSKLLKGGLNKRLKLWS